jgi:hypothetical protein
MLYLVGLGLAEETDITVRGLEIVKKAERVYLEAYTSILLVSKEKLVRPSFLVQKFCVVDANGRPLLLVGGFLWTSHNSGRSRNGRNL